MKRLFIAVAIILVLSISAMFIYGCGEKKVEEKVEEAVEEVQEMVSDTTAVDTTAAEEMMTE